jgi:hypothetical protein
MQGTGAGSSPAPCSTDLAFLEPGRLSSSQERWPVRHLNRAGGCHSSHLYVRTPSNSLRRSNSIEDQRIVWPRLVSWIRRSASICLAVMLGESADSATVS